MNPCLYVAVVCAFLALIIIVGLEIAATNRKIERFKKRQLEMRHAARMSEMFLEDSAWFAAVDAAGDAAWGAAWDAARAARAAAWDSATLGEENSDAGRYQA